MHQSRAGASRGPGETLGHTRCLRARGHTAGKTSTDHRETGRTPTDLPTDSHQGRRGASTETRRVLNTAPGLSHTDPGRRALPQPESTQDGWRPEYERKNPKPLEENMRTASRLGQEISRGKKVNYKKTKIHWSSTKFRTSVH